MSSSKPQILYGATVVSTPLFVQEGRTVRPLRNPDGSQVVLQSVCEDEKSEAQFLEEALRSRDERRDEFQAALDAQGEVPEPEAPKPSVVDELVPEAPAEEPVTVIDPKRAE